MTANPKVLLVFTFIDRYKKEINYEAGITACLDKIKPWTSKFDYFQHMTFNATDPGEAKLLNVKLFEYLKSRKIMFRYTLSPCFPSGPRPALLVVLENWIFEFFWSWQNDNFNPTENWCHRQPWWIFTCPPNSSVLVLILIIGNSHTNMFKCELYYKMSQNQDWKMVKFQFWDWMLISSLWKCLWNLKTWRCYPMCNRMFPILKTLCSSVLTVCWPVI